MKVRFLIANAYPGGGGTIRTTLNMANALAERGHDVEVISVLRRRKKAMVHVVPRVQLRPLVDTTPWATTGRWPHVLPGPRRRAREWALARPSRLIHQQDSRHSTFNAMTDLRLLHFLRSVRDGVLIATRPGLNLAVARYARPSVVRIGQEHLHLGRHRPKLREAITRYYPRLDALATLTPTDAKAYEKLLGNDPRIVAMPNAAPDMGGVRAALDNKIVVGAGRLTRQKGFDRLIPAFAQVAAKHPDWQLRIFGSGDEQERLQGQIDELGVGANVSLMGFTRQLPQELGKASVYALSSRFEGFPMVLLEAMSCGLPVTSFDCPTGPSDLVTHGSDGLIVPKGDVDGMAAAIIELVEDDTRRKAMGAAAFETAAEYQTPVLAQRWEALFTELAAARGLRSSPTAGGR
ncbi:MAG: glycosyltransferase family 4 protein [Egibacteraceae bacterium]